MITISPNKISLGVGRVIKMWVSPEEIAKLTDISPCRFWSPGEEAGKIIVSCPDDFTFELEGKADVYVPVSTGGSLPVYLEGDFVCDLEPEKKKIKCETYGR